MAASNGVALLEQLTEIAEGEDAAPAQATNKATEGEMNLRALVKDGKIDDMVKIQCMLLGDGSALDTSLGDISPLVELLEKYQQTWRNHPRHEQDQFRQHAKTVLSAGTIKHPKGDKFRFLSRLLDWRSSDLSEPRDIIDVDLINAQGVVLWDANDFKGARDKYTKAFAPLSEHPDPPEHTHLLYNFALLLIGTAKSLEELDRAENMIKRAMTCDRCLCGPFGDPTINNFSSDSRIQAREALNHLYTARADMEARIFKESNSRSEGLKQRLRAKLSQRSTETSVVVTAAEERMRAGDKVLRSACEKHAAEFCVRISGGFHQADLSAPAQVKKAKRKKRKPGKHFSQVSEAQVGDCSDEPAAINLEVAEAEAELHCLRNTEADAGLYSEADAARSPVEWRKLLQQRDDLIRQRDDELKERDDDLEEARDALQRMILFCDRQQSTIDELRKQVEQRNIGRTSSS